MRLAVIPARGGSRRIPRKNIKLFAGKPMITWAISAAQKSGCFDRIIVSTDDHEIAEVARNHGADVPFQRPAALSDDRTATIPVIAHAVSWQLGQGQKLDAVCCIYATAPFLSPDDLSRGLSALKTHGAYFAVSVTAYPSPIQRALRIDKQGRVSMLSPENFNRRSQDLEPAFHDAGQFYWGQAAAWVNETSVFGGATVPVILPSYRVQDIDTTQDWARAEMMMAAYNSKARGDSNG